MRPVYLAELMARHKVPQPRTMIVHEDNIDEVGKSLGFPVVLKQPDAALTNRVKAFEQRQDAANQELAKGQQNIQSIQANVVRQINEKLRPAINTVMTQKGANIAVDVGSTLAHGTGTDITNEVLAALNTALPAVSLTPLPQQQTQQTPQGR